MNGLMKYPQAETQVSGLGEIEPAGITQRLEKAKAHHERELAKINLALGALSEQPETAKLLELVMKAL